MTRNYDEDTLDPVDWEETRELAHTMVDDIINYLRDIREKATWKPVPDDIRRKFKTEIPRLPSKPEKVYSEFLEYILPYNEGNVHPRFYGWVEGTGTVDGMLADMLASGMNVNAAGGQHAATFVENQIVNWFLKIFNFPDTASGRIVSGGSMANLVALTVARNVSAGFDYNSIGTYGSPQRLLFYTSSETHSSVSKAVKLLGLGSQSVIKVPTNDQFEMDIAVLEEKIKNHKNEGHKPACIVATAGTTNVGSFDNIDELVKISQKYGLWLHVDGAFGALVRLSKKHNKLISGIEKVDSIAFDFHKWMYVNYEAGCVLIRNKMQHIETFSETPDYLEHGTRGLQGGEHWFSDFGIELSRRFKSLKIWMMIKIHGINKFGKLIDQNIHQANYFKKLIEDEDNFEILGPVPLNIVCFRYIPNKTEDVNVDEFNEELMYQVQESGIAILSSTKINGKFALRVCITNHKTKYKDLDVLLETISKLCKTVKI